VSIVHGFTLIASMAYSTWNRRPSGEKMFTPLSAQEGGYSEP